MSELVGIARFRFHPGKVEEYKRLSAAAMEIVRAKEPNTLEYSIYFNADESAAVVIERFRDVDALLEHGRNMAEIGAQVLTTGTVEGELLGEVNAEIEANLAQGEQPRHYRPWISKESLPRDQARGATG